MTTNEEKYIENNSLPLAFMEPFPCSLQMRYIPAGEETDLNESQLWLRKNDFLLSKNEYDVINESDINENTIQHAVEVDLCDEGAAMNEEVVDLVKTDSDIITCDLLMEEILLNALNIADKSDRNDYALVTSSSEDEDNIPRIRRSSSLKTGKTPPGTPSRKKIVRFADVLGLDLADVRTYLDEIPKIPTSAFNDLKNILPSSTVPAKTMLAMFQQPVSLANFMDKVTINMIMLENAMVDDPITLAIRGLVRVRNLDYSKSVHVRYTLDAWKTYVDVQATYVENSCDGFSDKFSFILFTNRLNIGNRLEFAVRFQCRGSQYWDNNQGANYAFQCMPATSPTNYDPIASIDDPFATFYYMDNNNKIASSDASHPSQLCSTAVQEYITKSLQNKTSNHHHHTQTTTKPELITFLMIIVFSILFFYVKRAIIF